MEYLGPDNSQKKYPQKFIRIENDFYVTAPGDVATQHVVLAEQDGITERMRAVAQATPEEVDAGRLAVMPFNESMGIHDASFTLGYPSVNEARARTVEVMQEKTSRYDVYEV